MQEIDPRALLENFHRQVMLAAIAARRIRQRRRRAARVLDELLEIPYWKRRIDREHELVRRYRSHRHEILEGVERHLRVQMRIDRHQAVLTEQQRVPVRG